MSQVTELLIRIRQQGDQQLTKLQGSLKSLAQQTAATNVNFKEVSEELRKIQATSTQSINNLRGYASTWREIANSVKVGTAEFKQASAEAAKLEAQLQKIQPSGPGRLKGLAKGAGTVAAAGVFGGPLGAVGALAGAPFGVAGMAAGGAIGAQAGMMGQQVASLASYTAGIEKQRIALKLITQDAASYQQGLDFIYSTSQRLAIPQELITRQFTQLSASVIGAGGNVKNAEKAFLGIAAGIRGTGGSLEDLDAALRATAQVFSKGKVSAEELRQQIGERLPGAFTLFAKSIGMTPKELDKALEDGRVTLQDFMKFAEELFKQYGKNAEIIARGPQSAGDRLQASLSKLSESVGRLLAPIGAAFQTIFADIVAAITGAANALARFFGMKFYDPERIADLEKRIREQSALVAGPADSMTARRRGVLVQLQKELREERSRIPKGGTGGGAAGAGFGVGEAEGTADREEKKAKKIVDLTSEQLQLGLDVLRFERQGLDILAENAKFLQREVDLQEKLKRGQIGVNGAILEGYQSQVKLEKAVEGAFRGFGADVIQALEKQQDARSEINRLIDDAIFKSKILNEEDKRRVDINKQLAAVIEKFAGVLTSEELLEAIRKLREALEGVAKAGESFKDNFKASFKAVADSALNLGANLGASLGNAFAGLGDQLAEFAATGKATFADFTRSVLLDLSKIFMRAAVFQTLKTFFPGGSAIGSFLGFANGGIMTGNGPLALKRYAAGGIASSPQLAMFGEGSRPEAYVPLPDGRTIPVTMKNGGGTSVVVNVDASGSSVQGNQPDANALGRVVGAAVQAELIKQKRPGGLLS